MGEKCKDLEQGKERKECKGRKRSKKRESCKSGKEKRVKKKKGESDRGKKRDEKDERTGMIKIKNVTTFTLGMVPRVLYKHSKAPVKN